MAHPWQTELLEGFESRFYSRRFGIDWRLLRLALLEKHSLFVTGSWHEPTIQIILTILMIRRMAYVIWTDRPNQSRQRNPFKALLRRNWLRIIFRHSLRVMGTGAPAVKVLEDMGCPKEKALDFPYFVDLEVFRPRSGTAPRRKVVFAAVGRLHRDKGYDIAIKAIAIARERLEDAFELRIAGTGPERDRLIRLTEENEIAGSVTFVGWLDQGELPRFLADADVFLHPARVEPFGVVVIEAMASGLIVVGSDATTAVQSRIIPRINGFIHRTEDPDDMAIQILESVKSVDGMQRMKARARESAEAWPVERGVAIIRQLVSDRA